MTNSQTTPQSSLESKLDALANRVENQARFTRAVILLCTLIIIAMVFYINTELLSTIPNAIIAICLDKASRKESTGLPKPQTAAVTSNSRSLVLPSH